MSKIVLAEQASAPDTPASGNVAIYVDDNGDLSWKDDAGNVTKIAAAGAYTLTVPATGTAALLARAQTFTAAQTISATGATTHLTVANTEDKSWTAGDRVGTLAWSSADTSGIGPHVVASMYVEAGVSQTSVAADLILATGYAAAPSERMRINYLGHVLIGTATDAGQLAVKAGSASTVGLVVDTAATPSAPTITLQKNGVDTHLFGCTAANYISLRPLDNGSAQGCSIEISRNSNASTPAAGFVSLHRNSGTIDRIWSDASGNLRIWTANPTNANDTAGTVVGTQTSQAATKDILGDGVSPADALAAVLAAPVYRFRYKSGAYNSTEFHGITTDDSPEFGMDQGRVFNPVSAFGYMVQTVKALHARIQQLEEQIANG